MRRETFSIYDKYPENKRTNTSLASFILRDEHLIAAL